MVKRQIRSGDAILDMKDSSANAAAAMIIAGAFLTRPGYFQSKTFRQFNECTHRIAAQPSWQDRRHRELHSRTRARRFVTTLTGHLRRRERPDRGCNGGAFCVFGELKPLATALILCPAMLVQSHRHNPPRGCAKFARSAMAGLFVCARSAAPSPDQAKHQFLLGLSQPGRVEDKIAAADRSFEPR